MRAPMRRGRKSRMKNSPLSSCSLRLSMESGTTGYSTECTGVEVIFAKNLTMTDTAGQHQHSHEVAADAAISCDGKPCGLTDLKAGDTITVTLDKKGDEMVATKIEAKKAGS